MLPHIKVIGFKAGASTTDSPLRLEDPKTVVLVGPNNSGKSLALREIEHWAMGTDEERLVVGELEPAFPPDPNVVEELVRRFETDPPEGQFKEPDRFWIAQPIFGGDSRGARRVFPAQLRSWTESQAEKSLRDCLLRLYTIRLDGRTRFALADPKPSGDLQQSPKNHLWALFQNDAARERVRQLTAEAFGRSFVIDPTAMTQFRIRLADRSPVDRSEEQGLDKRAREFHGAAPLVGDLSDGIQAFVGLVSAVVSLPHSVLLIDEPEAFLHPPLARRLGKDLSTLARERAATLVVATHSADFLFGCVEESPSTTIVRLTFEEDVATARSLPADSVQALLKDPLLRSTHALQGLFHRSVIVTEADADRAFYNEVNRRLLAESRGIEDSLFVNAQNWQTIPRVVGPLRSVGVPAGGVFDIDALAAEQSWGNVFRAAGVRGKDLEEMSRVRSECGSALRKAGGYKLHGRRCLPVEERPKLDDLIRRLGRYGVFVVPVGVLERWLQYVGVTATKKAWLPAIFDAMGSEPNQPSYARPGVGDVWLFVELIKRWVEDPNRAGMDVRI